jgi:hypothetical protein
MSFFKRVAFHNSQAESGNTLQRDEASGGNNAGTSSFHNSESAPRSNHLVTKDAKKMTFKPPVEVVAKVEPRSLQKRKTTLDEENGKASDKTGFDRNEPMSSLDLHKNHETCSESRVLEKTSSHVHGRRVPGDREPHSPPPPPTQSYSDAEFFDSDDDVHPASVQNIHEKRDSFAPDSEHGGKTTALPAESKDGRTRPTHRLNRLPPDPRDHFDKEEHFENIKKSRTKSRNNVDQHHQMCVSADGGGDAPAIRHGEGTSTCVSFGEISDSETLHVFSGQKATEESGADIGKEGLKKRKKKKKASDMLPNANRVNPDSGVSNPETTPMMRKKKKRNVESSLDYPNVQLEPTSEQGEITTMKKKKPNVGSSLDYPNVQLEPPSEQGEITTMKKKKKKNPNVESSLDHPNVQLEPPSEQGEITTMKKKKKKKKRIVDSSSDFPSAPPESRNEEQEAIPRKKKKNKKHIVDSSVDFPNIQPKSCSKEEEETTPKKKKKKKKHIVESPLDQANDQVHRQETEQVESTALNTVQQERRKKKKKNGETVLSHDKQDGACYNSSEFTIDREDDARVRAKKRKPNGSDIRRPDVVTVTKMESPTEMDCAIISTNPKNVDAEYDDSMANFLDFDFGFTNLQQVVPETTPGPVPASKPKSKKRPRETDDLSDRSPEDAKRPCLDGSCAKISHRHFIERWTPDVFGKPLIQSRARRQNTTRDTSESIDVIYHRRAAQLEKSLEMAKKKRAEKRRRDWDVKNAERRLQGLPELPWRETRRRKKSKSNLAESDDEEEDDEEIIGSQDTDASCEIVDDEVSSEYEFDSEDDRTSASSDSHSRSRSSSTTFDDEAAVENELDLLAPALDSEAEREAMEADEIAEDEEDEEYAEFGDPIEDD